MVFLILSQRLSLFLLPHILGSCATQSKGKKNNHFLVLEKKISCLARGREEVLFWGFL